MPTEKPMSRTAPAQIRRGIDVAEMRIGNPEPIILKDGSLASGGSTIEPIDKPLNSDYLDDLAFMEEPVEIVVAETTDPNAPNPVQVGVNGVFFAFYRGTPTVAKRKFVNALLVKGSRVSTPEYTNGAGERARHIMQVSALMYPFQVIHDPNPKGVEWLRRMTQEIL